MPNLARLTPREVDLVKGMIAAQQNHADTCNRIANRKMADIQRGWDLERIALLNKILDVMGPQK